MASSGFAFTFGRLDGNVTLDEVVEHAAMLDAAAAEAARALAFPFVLTARGQIGREP